MTEYEKPSLTVDTVLLSWRRSRVYVLLIKRKNDPFQGKWALPGGYLDKDEHLPDAAKRELEEETGVIIDNLAPIGFFDQPGRDPRGWYISMAFWAITNQSRQAKAGSDAAQAKWFALNNLPELAFDHHKIIQQAQAQLAHHAQNSHQLLQGVGEVSVNKLKQIITFIKGANNENQNS